MSTINPFDVPTAPDSGARYEPSTGAGVAAGMDSGRARLAQKALKLLPPGSDVLGLAYGRGNFRWRSGNTAIAVFYAVCFFLPIVGLVAMLFLAITAIPGIIMAFYFFDELHPKRLVLRCTDGVAIMHTGYMSGGPRNVLALLPLSCLEKPLNDGRRIEIPWAEGERVIVTKREQAHLLGLPV